MKEQEVNQENEELEQQEQETQEEVTESETQESPEDAVARERDEYLAGWQRSQADMKNLQKRHEDEKKMFTTLGKETLLQDLIPVLDNFDAAFRNSEVWESVDENWRRGIEYIHTQFVTALENNGVVAYGAVGDAFDTMLHEPVESVGDGEQVTAVLQKGYKIGDRVIRPAKVNLG